MNKLHIRWTFTKYGQNNYYPIKRSSALYILKFTDFLQFDFDFTALVATLFSPCCNFCAYLSLFQIILWKLVMLLSFHFLKFIHISSFVTLNFSSTIVFVLTHIVPVSLFEQCTHVNLYIHNMLIYHDR